ncbi:hypothetical protein AN958_08939 [Leucoagaricus sp. SymC.cos]|nr:hypothetical protein AN958_08939 [Leucoagaricus sp. SymC.cos]
MLLTANDMFTAPSNVKVLVEDAVSHKRRDNGSRVFIGARCGCLWSIVTAGWRVLTVIRQS